MSMVIALRGLVAMALPIALLISTLERRKVRAEPAPIALDRIATRTMVRRWIAAGYDIRDLSLQGADLHRLDLRDVRLDGADLTRTALNGAQLDRSVLRGARLRGADLAQARLTGADMHDADMTEASFWKADLRGVDLSNTRNLIMANLRQSVYDGSTVWPNGFDPVVAGSIRASDEPGVRD